MDHALLISPSPVDGYPPVQHQASLLADAGYEVELITTPLPWRAGEVRFAHPGVRIRKIPVFTGRSSAVRRAAAYVAAITSARAKLAQGDVEIVYEPIGMLYADFAPRRPRRRIAHFHECLQRLDTAWMDRRVPAAIRGYQLVVLPDAERAKLLAQQLGLAALPLVVPNFPMSAACQPPTGPRRRTVDDPFTVIYCGSLGFHQKLDVVIRSVRSWPQAARLAIVGNANTPIGKQLQSIAREAGVGGRVDFEGWLDYDAVPQRLARADVGIALMDTSIENWRTALGASNKRYEYMRAGLPQIGDVSPGVVEMLEGQGIGRCVREYTTEALAELVASYAADPERCHVEGERALRRHVETYNYQAAFRQELEWIGHASAS